MRTHFRPVYFWFVLFLTAPWVMGLLFVRSIGLCCAPFMTVWMLPWAVLGCRGTILTDSELVVYHIHPRLVVRRVPWSAVVGIREYPRAIQAEGAAGPLVVFGPGLIRHSDDLPDALRAAAERFRAEPDRRPEH